MTSPAEDPALRAWAGAHAATVTTRNGGAAPRPASPSAGPAPVLSCSLSLRTVLADSAVNVTLSPHVLPDGRLLLAGAGAGSTMTVWDDALGDSVVIHRWSGLGDRVRSVAWAPLPDGRQILAGAAENGTTSLWTFPDKALYRSVIAGGAGIYGVACVPIPGGHFLVAVASEDSVQVWGDTGELLYTMPQASTIYSVAWVTAPDGRPLLACGALDGFVGIWDGATGEPLHRLSSGRGAVYTVAWAATPDGRLLLAGACSAGVVLVWDGVTGELLHTLRDHDGTVWCVTSAVLPDGRCLLATNSTDRTVRLWDGLTGRCLHVAEFDSDGTGIESLTMAVLPDGEVVLAAATTEAVHLYDVTVGPLVSSPPPGPEEEVSGPVPPIVVDRVLDVTPGLPLDEEDDGFRRIDSLSTAVLTDGTFRVATVDTDQVEIWDGGTGVILRDLTRDGPTGYAWSVSLAPVEDGGLLLAAGLSGGEIKVWDCATGELRWSGEQGDETVSSVSWTTLPGGRLLLASAGDGVAVWDGHTGRLLNTITAGDQSLLSVTWISLPHGDDPWLVTAGNDGVARIWTHPTGDLLHTLRGHTETIHDVAAAVLPGGQVRVATAGTDSVRIWDGRTGELLLAYDRHGEPVKSVTMVALPDGRLLVASVGTQYAHIWDGHHGIGLASVKSTSSFSECAEWVFLHGEVVLAVAAGRSDPGPARLWRVVLDPPLGGTAPAKAAGPAAGRCADGFLALGAGELWPALGLVQDLVELTGPREARFNDERMRGLTDEPGIERLRELRWPGPARVAFAGLLAGNLAQHPDLVPPAGAGPRRLREALRDALAGGAGVRRPVRVDVRELREAAQDVTERTVTLLTILGAEACTADPLLPLRMAGRMAEVPVLDERQLRLLVAAETRRIPVERRPGGVTRRYEPGTAGLSRRGPLSKVLVSQLALPRDLLVLRHLENELLYREHRAPAPPSPEPVALVLDTTPPTHGPVEQVLRMAAHLVTTTLWSYGRRPVLFTAGEPSVGVTLAGRPDLARLWTARTLEPPWPALGAALEHARATDLPVVLLTHHFTARGGYVPGESTRLLTSHQPPEDPPDIRPHAYHRHLPPRPSLTELTEAVVHLLARR